MKKIYLVRHGKALKQEGFLDAERPLVPEGIKEAHYAAKYLQHAGITPTLLLSSPARRAADTAKIFCEEWQRPIESIQINERIYTDDQEGLWRLLRVLDDQHEAVCLFGHNPSFEELARMLAKHYDLPLPTGGIIGISCPVEFWRDLQKQKNTFDFLESLPQTSLADEEKRAQKRLQLQISQKIEEAVYAVLPEISSKMKEIIEQASKKLAKQKQKTETRNSDAHKKSEKSDKSTKSEKSDKSTKSEKSDKSTKSEKSDKSTKSEKSDKSTKSEKSDKSTKSEKSEKQKKVNLKHLALFGRCKGCKRKPKSISPKLLEKIARNLQPPQNKPTSSPANPREEDTSSPSLDMLSPAFAPPATEPALSTETHSFDAFAELPQEAAPSNTTHTRATNTEDAAFSPPPSTEDATLNTVTSDATATNPTPNTEDAAFSPPPSTEDAAFSPPPNNEMAERNETPKTSALAPDETLKETSTQTNDLTASATPQPSSSVDALARTDQDSTPSPSPTDPPSASLTHQRRPTKNHPSKKPKATPSSKNHH